ncbi:MAG: hypothetical protein HQ517_07450, partial [SAR324 cluster bacterium]|nr:hypothetical protein [SAR324 cluster bacterium]
VHIGEVRFEKRGSPTISDLSKSCGSDHVRKKVENANQTLINLLGLSGKYMSEVEIGDLLHFCECYPADVVPPNQLSRHYWIPISPKISLEKMGVPLGILRSGTLIGGKSWDLAKEAKEEEEKEEDSGSAWGTSSENSWNLGIPRVKDDARQTYLIGVIPESKLPWHINSSPLDEEFFKNHLPVIQWLIAQHLSNLVAMEQLRDLFFDRYAKISEVVTTEKKVRKFESGKAIVSEQIFKKIRLLVMETVGLNLGKDPRLSSELLSKLIYNRILEQTKKGFPNLTIEEQGNKAYTLWRYVQSQIVMEVFIKGNAEQFKLKAPQSIFEMISLVIEEDLKKMSIWGDGEGLDMLASPPIIDLKKFLQGDHAMMPDKMLAFALEVLHLVENYVVMLTDEAINYQKRLRQVSSIKTEFDIKEIQTRFISESIEKLQKTLSIKLPRDSLKQPEDQVLTESEV